MSNIGYAVFGRPRGMYSQSNGLFRELGLTSEFYLDDAHVILEKGQRVLMIKRYASHASGGSQSSKKDTVVVALYEYALQHGENRPGAFIGSAICFSENMPNVDKIISGLLFLFSQIKQSVDQDNRFTMPDSSNWQVNLPDPNVNFGIFENQPLTFNLLTPQDRSKDKTAVVKLNDFAKNMSSLLFNFLLNRSFHYIEHLYASDSSSVVNTIQRNGFKSVDFGVMFDYSSVFKVLEKELNDAKKELENIEISSKNTLDKIKEDEKKERELDAQIKNKIDKLESYKKEIETKVAYLEKLKSNVNKKSINSNSKGLSQRTKNTPFSTEENEKIKEFYALFTDFSEIIKTETNVKIPEPIREINEQDQNVDTVKYYFASLPKRREKIGNRNIIVLGSMLILILSLSGFLGYSKYKNSILNKEIKEITTKYQDLTEEVKKEKENSELLENINKYKKGGENEDYKQFKGYANTLLENFLNDKYENDSEEIKFIKGYNWEFWEFDYTNNDLVNKMELNDEKYFVDLKNDIKPINLNIEWKGKNFLAPHLNNYLYETNNIYRNIPKETLDNLKQDKILEDHFKWVIKKANNKEYEEIGNGSNMGLPFIKE